MAEQPKGHKRLAGGEEGGAVEAQSGSVLAVLTANPIHWKCAGVAGQGKREGLGTLQDISYTSRSEDRYETECGVEAKGAAGNKLRAGTDNGACVATARVHETGRGPARLGFGPGSLFIVINQAPGSL